MSGWLRVSVETNQNKWGYKLRSMILNIAEGPAESILNMLAQFLVIPVFLDEHIEQCIDIMVGRFHKGDTRAICPMSTALQRINYLGINQISCVSAVEFNSPGCQ